MALPIGATPVLRGKRAVEFLEMIHADAAITVTLTPTPKLTKALRSISVYAKRQQKRTH